jgi:hypothetical protein
MTMAEPVSEHGDVGTDMRAGHRLAEDVGALQVAPLALGVGALSRGAGRRAFVGPSFVQVFAIRFHVESSL